MSAWIKQKFPGIVIFDFDNYSENYLVDQAIELAENSEKLIVLIQAGPKVNTGQATRFLNRIFRMKKNKVLVLFEGENDILEKMIKIVDENHLILQFNVDKHGDILLNFLI